MNLRLLCQLLSLVAVLIGAAMLFSLPWALPALGGRWEHERAGFFGLLGATAACLVVAWGLHRLGRGAQGQLFRREAMAVVGLSWILATVLGALPFVFSGVHRAEGARMTPLDAVFEAQSGFSTTGATVLSDVENPALVPRCILFWRSSTHFLGGLGIIVLFVAILGQGSAGKALMRAEMPGPSKATPQARMQQTAWVLFLIYATLNLVLAVVLVLEGLSPFDAICHAFGTMATGGFSTRNASVGHYAAVPGVNGPLVEMTIAVFMVLAGTNFMLLYWLVLGQPRRVAGDVEWRCYVGLMLLAAAAVAAIGLYHGDFEGYNGMTPPGSDRWADADTLDRAELVGEAARLSLFQVVSIMTTTGFCTDDFDRWNGFARGLLVVLMFVGGCAGSTGGGLKVIRVVLLAKILRLEIEQAYHPNVIRPLRLGGEVVADPALRKNILVYFCAAAAIFVVAWLCILAWEPDATWSAAGRVPEHKLSDAAACVAATLNNIGPGLGVVGATRNYAGLSAPTKLLLIALMMLGRLEIFVVVVLFMPSFWRAR